MNKESLPPAPDDLWPKVSSPSAKERRLIEQDLGLDAEDLAITLGRCACLEMRGAGERSARAEAVGLDPLRRAQTYLDVRIRTHSAARLLALYEEIHRKIAWRGAGSSLPSVDRLKEAATKHYREALRDEREVQQQLKELRGSASRYNDALYEQLRRKPSGPERKFKR